MKIGLRGGIRRLFYSDVVFNAILAVFVVAIFFVYAVPLLYIVNASLSSSEAIFSGKMLFIPEGINLQGYAAVFGHRDFMRSFLNSVLYCGLALVISIPVTVMAAYPLSRKDFAAKKFIMVVYTVTMFFGGGLVPTYMLVTGLGLYDNPLALVLPGVSVWNVIVVRQYFVTRIGGELFEAAEIDGCSNFDFLLFIGFPLAMPIIIVVSIYTVVGQWNSYFNAMLYLDSRNLYPLQLILRELLLSGDGGASGFGAETAVQAEAMKFAMIIISALPVITLYAFLQKYFIKGVMVGSLKG